MSGRVADEVLRVTVDDEQDVFAVRQAGRDVAGAVGLDAQDQVRVATALSELGRELFTLAGRVAVAFLLERGERPSLLVELTYPVPSGEARPEEGVRAASRLMDLVVQDENEGSAVLRATKWLPASAPPVDDAGLAAVRDRLGHRVAPSALEELRTQNAELLEALDDARRQREELRALNAELEDTNRGVLALYNQLSTELEDTNRGVVALYAELEEKSDQLREASEGKNRFWANISHELRTPVNAVIGLSRLLLDPAADPLTAEQRHQISLVSDTGDTLLALVDELLDMARAEQGRLEPRPGPVDVTALAAHLSDLLEPTARQSGVRLVSDTAAAPDTLVTDETMLTRILRNVLANGLKYTEAGEVRLTVAAEADVVVFAVADTGRGIPVADRDRVFEEFYRVPGTGVGGTGLGLPYARRLAHALGGELELDSVLGEGTTVTLRLPRHPGSETFPELAHVLIVDDVEADRRALRELLGGSAGRVSEAAGGREALAAAEADPPALVLLDLRMPGGDGYEVLAGLPPHVPVVLVTSVSGPALDDPRLDRAGALVDKARLSAAVLADAMRRALRREGP